MTVRKNYDIQQTLQDMRADYWRHLETQEEQGELLVEEYLVVQIADQRYAIHAPLCKEVLKLPPLVRVPRVPVHIRGIFNLRGEIVAVTDLAPLLGNPPQQTTGTSRLVVVAQGLHRTALLVDAVEGLTQVDVGQIEPLAEGAAAGLRDLFRGKRVIEQQTLLILDIASVLSRPELLIDQKGPQV